MFMDSQDGPPPDGPPLDELYRKFSSHISRALFESAKQRALQLYNVLEGVRVALEAWADIIGYKRDVLEQVEKDDRQLADKTRKSLLILLGDLEHVEYWLKLRVQQPSNGDPLRHEAANYLREHLMQLLQNQTGEFTSFTHRRAKAKRQSVSRMPSDQGHRRHPSMHNYSPRSNYEHVGTYSSPAPMQRPSPVTSQSMYTVPTNGHRVSTSTHIIRPPSHHGDSAYPMYRLSATIAAGLDQISSRPSTAESNRLSVPPQSLGNSIVSAFPPVSQVLHSPEVIDDPVLHTPSTTSLSPHSSPMTPPHNLVAHKPSATQFSWSNVTLSPILPGQLLPTNQLQAMEPRINNFSGPSYNGDSSRLQSSAWLATTPRRSLPFDRRSGLF